MRENASTTGHIEDTKKRFQVETSAFSSFPPSLFQEERRFRRRSEMRKGCEGSAVGDSVFFSTIFVSSSVNPLRREQN